MLQDFDNGLTENELFYWTIPSVICCLWTSHYRRDLRN